MSTGRVTRARARFQSPKSAPAVKWSGAPFFVVIVLLAGLTAMLWTNVRQFSAAQRTSRLQTMRTSIDDQFRDSLDRLANRDNPMMRSNAVLQLADLSKRPDPLRSDDIAIGKMAEMNSQNFPYFRRSMLLLASALRLEPASQVRLDIRKALRELTEFGSHAAPDGTQPLMELYVQELIDANRGALTEFLRSFAQFRLLNDNGVDGLAALAPFCPTSRESIQAVRDLAHEPVCEAELNARRLVSQRPDNMNEAIRVAMVDLQKQAAILIDCRDALCRALKTLAPPVDMPTDPMKLAQYKRPHPIDLTGCFLVNGDLESANLQGTILVKANLYSANLSKASLQAADLVEANLRRARLGAANLSAADFNQASLESADLYGTRLQGTMFRFAKLTGTKFFLAEFQATGAGSSPDFFGSKWWEADYYGGDGKHNAQLWTYLKSTYHSAEPKASANEPPKPATPNQGGSTQTTATVIPERRSL